MSSTGNLPQEFHAAQFTQQGGQIELRKARMKEPRPEG